METEGSFKLKPSLSSEFAKRVRPYIDLIDRLRSLGLDQDINLPSVVVIGDQSTGKSSVLEAISGVQLPRGTGIVTRCPLELCLVSCKDEGLWEGTISYIDVDGNKGCRVAETLEDPSEVDEAVRGAQEKLTRGSTGISSSLITLKIRAHGIPDLTLIDLPGIARNAADGQDEDIEEQIKELISEYIEKKETIILAVTPCNVDIATTEALKMARHNDVDPHGERTLGVLTKADLVDKGAEADVMAVVNNQVVRLKKGFTIVKCRSQKEVMDKKSLADVMKEEDEFFRKHEYYRAVYPVLTGIKSLSQKLTDELVEQIKRTIPELKTKTKTLKAETQKELHSLHLGPPIDKNHRHEYLLNLLTDFTDSVRKVTFAEYDENHGRDTHLFSKAKKYFEQFAKEIEDLFPDPGFSSRDDNSFSGDTGFHFSSSSPVYYYNDKKSRIETYKRQIEREITEQRGRELPRFMSFAVCKKLILETLRKFEPSAYTCLDDVNTLVENVFGKLASAHFKDYPELEGHIKGIVNKLQADAFNAAQKQIDTQFKMEEEIFTQDKVYLECFEKKEEDRQAQLAAKHASDPRKSQPMQVVAKPKLTPQESLRKEANNMFELIQIYIEVATRRLIDQVPMIIMSNLLTKLCTTVRDKILQEGFKESTLEMLTEIHGVAEKRKMLEDRRKRLIRAESELGRF